MYYDTASKVAEFLLQIKAIKLSPTKPFTWSSGWKSPIYCDNRIALSHPRIRTFIRQELVKCIDEYFGKPDVIAGVATGAIAQGVLVAEALGLPFVYVRPKAKDHGMQNLIEGDLSPNASVVVIEDLISTGKSSLNAIQALKDHNAIVKGMVSIFTYGFPEAEDSFKSAGVPVYSLSNYETLLNIAVKSGIVNEKSAKDLKKWKDNPSQWDITIKK
ncbi:MAG TPA: orotate phosphoribosyltransferase [Bacteroidia bacterium]|nr:orotate phosphoribosyltransferase [Bacteroidia bacterium]HNT79486.1 orotate phosphoribosyltransferase [Bacteroidia bacterium]